MMTPRLFTHARAGHMWVYGAFNSLNWIMKRNTPSVYHVGKDAAYNHDRLRMERVPRDW